MQKTRSAKRRADSEEGLLGMWRLPSTIEMVIEMKMRTEDWQYGFAFVTLEVARRIDYFSLASLDIRNASRKCLTRSHNWRHADSLSGRYRQFPSHTALEAELRALLAWKPHHWRRLSLINACVVTCSVPASDRGRYTRACWYSSEAVYALHMLLTGVRRDRDSYHVLVIIEMGSHTNIATIEPQSSHNLHQVPTNILWRTWMEFALPLETHRKIVAGTDMATGVVSVTPLSFTISRT